MEYYGSALFCGLMYELTCSKKEKEIIRLYSLKHRRCLVVEAKGQLQIERGCRII